MSNTASGGAARRINPQNPPYPQLRALMRTAYNADTLPRLAEYPGFTELRFRVGLKADLDDLIDEVFELARTRLMWEELLNAVAAEAPRAYNALAREEGWDLVAEPAIAPQPGPISPQPAPVPIPPPAPKQRVDVEIHITARAGDTYPVYIETSLAGDAQGTFTLPWSEGDLMKHLGWLEMGPTDRDGLATLGTALFDALLTRHVRDRYIESRGRAESGLRLRLRLDAPELQALPWELLYDAERQEFLAIAGETLITRYLAVPRGRPPLAVQPPLRVLLFTANPSGSVPLQIDAEVAAVRDALARPAAAGQVQLDVLPSAQVLTLRDKLRDFQPHVLHFIGHGQADQEGGALLLEDEEGGKDYLPGSTLATVLKRTNVRLAILNACLTSRGATVDLDKESFYARRRTLLGVGPALIDAGLGAVIANQFSVRDWSARVFAQDFYRTLARLEPIDEAVSRAREALMLKFDEEQRDWATPVLFLRSPDGVIFQRP
ncbi:MAG: CHAT domain-containing protein [Anaerolineae bacterium]|nr:CHAT domain-containing protein [Anaerolineae bacterium]